MTFYACWLIGARLGTQLSSKWAPTQIASLHVQVPPQVPEHHKGTAEEIRQQVLGLPRVQRRGKEAERILGRVWKLHKDITHEIVSPTSDTWVIWMTGETAEQVLGNRFRHPRPSAHFSVDCCLDWDQGGVADGQSGISHQ
jgi:hypothetical protein